MVGLNQRKKTMIEFMVYWVLANLVGVILWAAICYGYSHER